MKERKYKPGDTVWVKIDEYNKANLFL